MIETVDISLVDEVPTVLQVLAAIRPNFQTGKLSMAREFLKHNSGNIRDAFAQALRGSYARHRPHVELRRLVPGAIGLIRTGEMILCANVILESA